jgi:hypothetical protein
MQTLLLNLPLAAAWLFAAASLTHLMAPRWLQNLYARMELPRFFPYVGAALNLVAAVLLASPTYRVVGFFLGEAVGFFLGGRGQRQ